VAGRKPDAGRKAKGAIMVDIRIENHSSIAESQRERQRAAHGAFLLALPDALPAFLAKAVRC
jgi:hypothetical protein